ncbi:unnamed protein product [Soboliphyme baturini]|uniref:Guanine nucleotide-binding protein subunit beta-like protein n=1 Tax=Soboliphyme baturini TaxID=241478 RepID=A0A183J8J6_9BILA|nr:unnamed protein product [Soboliphyme baturini]
MDVERSFVMASTSSNGTPRGAADPVCRPRMGVRDIGRQTPLTASVTPVRRLPPSSVVYSSERSLPEKFTSAIRNLGRKAVAFNRMNLTTAAVTGGSSSGGTTAVDDDDLVFFSSSNAHSMASRSDRKSPAELTSVKANHFARNHLSYSKSAEKLSFNGSLTPYRDPKQSQLTATDRQSGFCRFQSDLRLSRNDADRHYENLPVVVTAKAELAQKIKSRNACSKNDPFYNVNPCCSSMHDLPLKQQEETERNFANRFLKEKDGNSRITSTSPTDSGYRSVPRSTLTTEDSTMAASPNGMSSHGYANFNGAVMTTLDELRKGQQSSRPTTGFGEYCEGTVASNDIDQTNRASLIRGGGSEVRSMYQNGKFVHECSPGSSIGMIDGKPSEGYIFQGEDAAFLENGGSIDTLSTNVSLPEEYALVRCPKLVELTGTPWTEKTIVALTTTGRLKLFAANRVTASAVPKIHRHLQTLFTRIARELQRFCRRFSKCSKHDVHYATKVILPTGVAENCLKAAVQAVTMYTMSGTDSVKQSRSMNAGLTFSVGKFFRWLCDAQVSN